MQKASRRSALAILLALSMALCGCKAVPTSAKSGATTVLGFSQLGSESAWRTGNSESIRQAAETAGISLMFQDANQKQENQINALRSFIAYQVDVIAFSPIVEDGWDNVLQEAQKAGIPVILVDRMVDVADESLYAAYVGADFQAEGIKAGQFLLTKADELGRNKLNVVEISGTEDATPTLQRHQGFHSVVDGDGRIVTLATVSGDFLRSKGKECMEELIAAYGKDIDVLYSHNDAMTLGAIDAMEEAGIVPGADVMIITVDGEQAAIDLLKAGKINCVVECTPMLGPLVMELMTKLMAGENVARITHPEEQVFTEYDDLSGIAPRGY